MNFIFWWLYIFEDAIISVNLMICFVNYRELRVTPSSAGKKLIYHFLDTYPRIATNSYKSLVMYKSTRKSSSAQDEKREEAHR